MLSRSVALVAMTLAGASAPALAQELVPEIEITYDTSVANPVPQGGGAGYYEPMNIGAVWVETEAGAFVKTVFKANSERNGHLVEHAARAPAGDVDGISGATRLNHDFPVVVHWDLTDRSGQEVPNGTYKLVLELADSNAASGVGTNNLGELLFTLDRVEATQVLPSGAGFDNIAVTYQLVPAPANPPQEEAPPEEDGEGDRWTIPGLGGDGEEEPGDSADGQAELGGGCQAATASGNGIRSWVFFGLLSIGVGAARRRRRDR